MLGHPVIHAKDKQFQNTSVSSPPCPPSSEAVLMSPQTPRSPFSYCYQNVMLCAVYLRFRNREREHKAGERSRMMSRTTVLWAGLCSLKIRMLKFGDRVFEEVIEVQ